MNLKNRRVKISRLAITISLFVMISWTSVAMANKIVVTANQNFINSSNSISTYEKRSFVAMNSPLLGVSESVNKNIAKNIIQFPIVFTFIFYLVCITVNYGYRVYWNSPLHPSFMPFVFVAIAAILAFTVVLAFDIAIGGIIKFTIISQSFEGASGPVILWILTFLSIMLGFRLSGATDMAKSEAKANPASHHLLKEKANHDDD